MDIKTKLRANCNQCMLAKLCLPAGIDRQDLEQLTALLRTNVSLVKDQHLTRTGQALSDLYIVSAGALKTVIFDELGNETVVAFHLPGELVGLDALATGEHQGNCVSLAEARVCKIPVSKLDEASQAIPGLQRQLMRLMGRCLQREQSHSDTLSRMQAMERVARFILELSERYGAAGLSDVSLQLPMSRQDIAKFLGVALETVSRNFSRLQDDGVIEVSGRRVQILNPQRLREHAQVNASKEPCKAVVAS